MRNPTSHLLFTFIAFLFVFSVSAATYTTTATAGTWPPAGTPANGDNFIVNHNWKGYDFDNISIHTGTWTINSGGYMQIGFPLNVTTGSVTVNSGGTFHVTTTLTFGAGATIVIDELLICESVLTNSSAITGSGRIYADTYTELGSNTTTLPVELIHFSVQKSNIENILTWSTASEVNNDYFEVQRSFDGVNFEEITSINGAGNSASQTDYSYTDVITSTQNIYYRLKQVDFDGTHTYSNVKSVSPDKYEFEIVQSRMSNQFSVVSNTEAMNTIEVYDQAGNRVSSVEKKFNKGDQYNFSFQKSGLYFISITNEFGKHTKKTIVQM